MSCRHEQSNQLIIILFFFYLQSELDVLHKLFHLPRRRQAFAPRSAADLSRGAPECYTNVQSSLCETFRRLDDDKLSQVETYYFPGSEGKIKILEWNSLLASQHGIHLACSPSHVQELVMHWMATGSISYCWQTLVRICRHADGMISLDTLSCEYKRCADYWRTHGTPREHAAGVD